MIPQSYRILCVLLVLFWVLLLGSVKEVVAQKKERVGRHSPAYMHSVLYLYNNRGRNINTIVYLGKSKEKQALFGGFNIKFVDRAFDTDLYDYRGLVKRQPEIEIYEIINRAISVSTLVVIAIEGIDVSHYKAITPELYPFEKESPDIKIVFYTGMGKNQKLIAFSCKGAPPEEIHLELKLAPLVKECFLHLNPKPVFNPDTGKLYGLASSTAVRTVTPKFIAWMKEEGLSVSPKASLTTSWGAIKSEH